jgi:hypothetical protein
MGPQTGSRIRPPLRLPGLLSLGNRTRPGVIQAGAPGQIRFAGTIPHQYTLARLCESRFPAIAGFGNSDRHSKAAGHLFLLQPAARR